MTIMLVSPADLPSDHWLGPLLEVSHDRAVIVADACRLPRSGGLAQGALCFMTVRSSDAPRAFGPTSHADVNDKLAFVLRVSKFVEWPREGSRLERRLLALLGDSADADRQLLIECRLLGVFAANPQAPTGMSFSADPGQVEHSDRYDAYVATRRMQQLFVNGTVDGRQRIRFGQLRDSEMSTSLGDPPITACLSMLDIRGKRTAMFGKTRLGKSNVVKLLVQGMLDVTATTRDVGQLIFDVNGEYANSNPQDGAENIGAVYADRCLLYYLSDRVTTGNSKLLRFNFHERPEDAMATLQELLPSEVADSDYVRPLLSCRLPGIDPIPNEPVDQSQRRLRKLMIYWTILQHAGFDADEERIARKLTTLGYAFPFNPGFPQPLRMSAYQAINATTAPTPPRTFAEMTSEVALVLKFSLAYPNDPALRKGGSYLFDADEEIMAAFLHPDAGAGPYVLRPAVPFHSPKVDNFITEILSAIDAGETVIVDLGSANERIIRYFAKTLSIAVFLQQESKFVRNEMQGRFVQIYFEEAHMIFPPNSGNVIDVYSRFAKEGAKFNIGIVYSTQSPSTVNQDLLTQTENFFIGHLSSERETGMLSSVQYGFKGMEEAIMRSRSPGFMRMLTASHRFPIQVQANRYDGRSLLV